MKKEDIENLLKMIERIYGLTSLLQGYEIDREIDNFMWHLENKD